MMSHAFELRNVTKRYAATVALQDVNLAAEPRSIIGLVGRNGSGKTTLLRHVTGLILPTSGECITLGCPTATLGRAELSRIGVVNQGDSLLEWMTAGQLIGYVSHFYERWDGELERALVDELELDMHVRVGALSAGNVQKLQLVMATCHHPELLLLDEPLSDLDPIARQSVLAMLLDRFNTDEMTIVISSHMLRDIEPVVNRIVCLDRGRVTADDDLDALRDSYAEWIVSSASGTLPLQFTEDYVLSAQGDRHQARLLVKDPAINSARFSAAYNADIQPRPVNLEQIFPLIAGGGKRETLAGRNSDAGAARVGVQ